jgi:hypothetical protein
VCPCQVQERHGGAVPPARSGRTSVRGSSGVLGSPLSRSPQVSRPERRRVVADPVLLPQHVHARLGHERRTWRSVWNRTCERLARWAAGASTRRRRRPMSGGEPSRPGNTSASSTASGGRAGSRPAGVATHKAGAMSRHGRVAVICSPVEASSSNTRATCPRPRQPGVRAPRGSGIGAARCPSHGRRAGGSTTAAAGLFAAGPRPPPRRAPPRARDVVGRGSMSSPAGRSSETAGACQSTAENGPYRSLAPRPFVWSRLHSSVARRPVVLLG